MEHATCKIHHMQRRVSVNSLANICTSIGPYFSPFKLTRFEKFASSNFNLPPQLHWRLRKWMEEVEIKSQIYLAARWTETRKRTSNTCTGGEEQLLLTRKNKKKGRKGWGWSERPWKWICSCWYKVKVTFFRRRTKYTKITNAKGGESKVKERKVIQKTTERRERERERGMESLRLHERVVHACMYICALVFLSRSLSFSYASKSDAIRLSTDAILMQP